MLTFELVIIRVIICQYCPLPHIMLLFLSSRDNPLYTPGKFHNAVMRIAGINFQKHYAMWIHFGIETFLGIDGLEVLLAPYVANGLRSTHTDGMRNESDGLRLVCEVEEADCH